ncbi:MAG: NADH-quinone oxidoreductase subunit G [bacterium]|nr:NADH-quinone oxidoreductase subunit G [bacterium]
MPKLIIDGAEMDVEDGLTLLQACEQAGSEIPRFCYHERLSIAGNCRMCLVEVKGMPKLAASCALGVNDLRPGPEGQPPEILTTSPLVQKARSGTLEFLLINHPLDCPICDQGGECDLQDQAVAFGVGTSRYDENKRAIENRNISPLIKTIMTRCISCTRCVRFMTEIAGVEELGQIGRGEGAEITTYLNKGMLSELSGNVVDICPVGALTHRPFAFTARPWEMKKTESIDVMDAQGAHIRIDTRGGKVLRILPRENDAINEEWITDKTRFVCDGLKNQRLDTPYIKKNGKLRPATWAQAFEAISKRMNNIDGNRFAAIAGDLAAVEEVFALKTLSDYLGSPHIDCRTENCSLSPDGGRAGYLFNTTIVGLDKADVILMIGTDPRSEASVMNARIRRGVSTGQTRVGLVGAQVDLSYDHDYLGAGPQTLVDILEGKHEFSEVLKTAKNPMLIVGEGAIARSDGRAVLALAGRLANDFGMICEEDDWNGFNILHTAAGRVGAMDIGFLPGEGGLDTNGILAASETGNMEVVYLLGADEIDVQRLANSFVIYQGSHGDNGAAIADVILPGAAYSEKTATYVNFEGRPQMTMRAVFPPGEAREDWTIIRALSQALGKTLPYDNSMELRKQIYEVAPQLAAIGQITSEPISSLRELSHEAIRIQPTPFVLAIDDFYLTNPVTRASVIMAEMSTLKQEMNAEQAAANSKGMVQTHG